MASLKTINATCNDIRYAEDMGEVARLIASNPVVLLQKNGVASIMQSIPHILKNSGEGLFNFDFITTILNVHRKFSVEKYKGIANPDESLPMKWVYADDPSPHDWALDILRSYAEALSLVTEGRCFSACRPEDDAQFASKIDSTTYRFHPQFCYTGWVVLCCRFNSQNMDLNQMVQNYYLSDPNRFAAFLYVLTDASIPLNNKTLAIGVMTNVWNACIAKDREILEHIRGDLGTTFISKAKNLDIGWLDSCICDSTKIGISISSAHGCIYEELMEDCHNIFVALSNIFSDNFAAENYFFDYIEELSYQYPLSDERDKICMRYGRFFENPDYAYMIMADICGLITQEFGMLMNYKDDPRMKMAYNLVHKRIELQLLDIHRQYPSMDADVLHNFFKEILTSFGRGFNGASEGCMLVVDAIISAIFKGDKVAIESSIDYLGLLAAMEADDENSDDGFNPSENKEDEPEAVSDEENTYGKHERAKVRNRAANMNNSEMKVYAAYKKYKDKEEGVDIALTKIAKAMKNFVIGDQRRLIIEGKSYTVIGVLKKVLLTVGIFNASKLAGILFLIVTFALSKKCQRAEKKKILYELELELEMVNEKIDDARGDQNRQAKYELMRTRNAIQNAIKRIKIGVGAKGSNGAGGSANNEYLPANLRRG